MSIPQLERDLSGARVMADACSGQLHKCRERRQRAESKLAQAGVATLAADLAGWLAERQVMSDLEPRLVAELKRAERVVTEAETELEAARARLVDLEASAELPADIAAAQAELAALRGA
jgi:predicted  nucleic acid-binding Zn-ribbon protein